MILSWQSISTCMLGDSMCPCVAGIILTGGIRPHDSIMELVKKTNLPMVLVDEDTYTVASKITKLIVKIRPG